MPPKPAMAKGAGRDGDGGATPLSIRAQAKAAKGEKQLQPDRSRMSKDVVKAVLASPLTVPWPNIPKHLQTTVMHALPRLVPSEVADYHVSRARRHTSKRVVERKAKRAVKRTAEGGLKHTGTADSDPARMDLDDHTGGAEAEMEEGDTEVRREVEDSTALATKPAVLEHLVLGINEIIKSLEKSIADLKMRLIIMSDALNDQASHKSKAHPPPQPKPNHLLPTAPRSPSPSMSPSPDEEPTLNPDQPSPPPEIPTPTPTKDTSSLVFIIIPLLSINPQTLVSPIPQYAATHNSLVYQHVQLAKHVTNRLPKQSWVDVVGLEVQEVRVVPLGNVEKELAEMVGLRRLACLGFKATHPAIQTLHTLLPKSILHPPRHHMTLPYPTSPLKIFTGNNNTRVHDESRSQAVVTAPLPAPAPSIHYAPLTIKGIQTTAPVDNASRKKRRLEEVRAKRVEVKKRKREERLGLVKKAGSKGKQKHKPWKGREGKKAGGGQGAPGVEIRKQAEAE